MRGRPSSLPHFLISSLILLLLLALGSAALAQAPGRGQQILPESFLRGYDPVTVFFSDARGPANGGPEDYPEKYAKMEPAQPGEWRWVDARTLMFRPAIPWAPLEKFGITAAGQSRTLYTMMAPPAKMVPADKTVGLGAIAEVALTFKEPIASEKLAQMVSFELRALPGVDKRSPRWLTASDYTIKAIERNSIGDMATYVFRFKNPVPDGLKCIVHLKLSLEEKSRDSFVEYFFSTKEPFRILSAGCVAGEVAPERPGTGRGQGDEQEGESYEGEGEGGEEGSGEGAEEPSEEESGQPPSRSAEIPGMLPLTVAGTKYTREQAVDGGTGVPKIAVQFSDTLAPLTLSDVKALVRFTPAIPEMSFTQAGPSLYVTGKVSRDTLYKATLQPAPIRDARGRNLQMAGASEFFFFYPREAAYLRWAQSQGIMERYGPQMFPVSARGDARVDLRIYKVDPLDRGFWPFPGGPVVVDESQRPPGPGEEPPPADSVRQYVSATELGLRLKLLGSPPVSKIVPLPVRKEGGATDFGLDLREHLAAISGPDQPGTYLVGVRRLSDESARQFVRVQVTDLCLSTVEEQNAVEFVVTSLKTGLPVPGATVTVEGFKSDATKYETLLTGTTDGTGRYRFVHTDKVGEEIRRIFVRSGSDALVILPSDPPYAFSNNHWYGPRGIWLGWLTREPYVDPEAQVWMCHLFTERPVYRPEEPVYIKGYLRIREKGRLKIATEGNWELLVRAPGDKEFTYPVELTEEGSFAQTFEEPDLATGTYEAVLRDIDGGDEYGGVSWKMEAYKIPRFEVALHGPDKVPMDREFAVNLTASYYAGGRVVGQPVLWRVTQFPYAHVPAAREGFLFSSDERFSRPTRFAAPGAIEKNDKTDESGASKITMNPALEIDARPRRYFFEATVTGADEQTVSANKQVIALPPFVLGVQVDRFLKNVKTITPKIIALDVDDKPLADQEVTVRLLLRQWHSHLSETDFSSGQAKYVTDLVDTEVTKTTLKTAAEPVTVSLPAERAGIYVVEISSRDKLGRLQLVAVDLYVSGPEALTWRKPEANVFETVPDKTDYAPGDNAQILLKSPFQEARVLAVVEGPDGPTYQEFGITGGKGIFNLAIKNEFNPRVPVHFVLMRGRISRGVGATATGKQDLGKPHTVAATCWLKVNPVGNTMKVELTHPDKVLPGAEVTIEIKLATPEGQPIPGEVTLWLVDQAVLSLGKEKRLDPVPSFIRDVESHISVRDTRNRTIGEVPTEESPAGGGTEEDAGILGRVTVRKDFRTVPYYNPRIMVDASGVAKVTFKISDDLTNFMVRAVACSGQDRFGYAKSKISVRLPVIAQPALPRFARIGDSFTAGGIGRIVEGEGGPGRCEIQVDGAILSGETSRSLEWTKDKPERLYWPMKILPPKVEKGRARPTPELKVTIGVRRDSDKAADAFEVRIPILPDRDPVKVEAFQKLEPGQPLPFSEVKEPAREGTVQQSLLITDQEALLKLVAGLDYLYGYSHQCTEQRVSQAYPTVALRGLLEAFKMKGNEQKADEILKGTFDYLGQTLQPSGLYSYWPGGRGYVSLTAYVVQFLVEAKRSGYQYPAKLLDKPVAALKDALRSDYSGFIDGYAFMERCEALLALSMAGEFDVSYGSELARKSGYLDLYSEAQVLMAYQQGQKGGDALLVPLRKDMWDNTVFKLRDGREVYGGLQSRIKEWGGLILASEVKTQAAVIRSLYAADAQSPKMQLMLGDLIEAGKGDGWGNTNANASALLCLRDVLKAPKKHAKGWDFDVAWGDQHQALRLDNDSPTASFVTGDPRPAKVTWKNGEAGESLFARLNLTYLPQATGETVASKNDGFVVRREVIRVPKDASLPPDKEWIEKEGRRLAFKIGDVIEEHVQVINPEARHYVAVVAPFAAGMEPMNPNLATSPKEAQPSGTLTLEPSYTMYLDNEVRFYYETLPAGTYDFYFRTRATTEGNYVHPAARAEMMYRQAVQGNSPGARYVVEKGE